MNKGSLLAQEERIRDDQVYHPLSKLSHALSLVDRTSSAAGGTMKIHGKIKGLRESRSNKNKPFRNAAGTLVYPKQKGKGYGKSKS